MLILSILINVEFHLFLEKNGVAPFSMNCVELLKGERNHIIRNQFRFKKDKFGMWEDLENINQAIKKNMVIKFYNI